MIYHLLPVLSYSLFLALLCEPSWPQEGYRLLSNQVLIEQPEHWQAWQAPAGVRLIDSEGRVEPRFLRGQINAALEASRFTYVNPFVSDDTLQGGIGAAGTARQTAPLILDGDPETYWEPDRQSPLDDWFVEIDLGRAVIARRVVLRFAEEGRGDPFLKFRVMISDGQRFGQEQRLRYFRVGLETRPNKEQREYAFEIGPQRPVPEGIEGEIAQMVRVDVVDTDGPRAQEVSLDEYLGLAPEDQGAIDYFRLIGGGREIRVSESAYRQLPQEERGPIRYFRHERPRLAEVEVFALGENVVGLTQRELERDPGEGGFEFLFSRIYTDGLYSSWFPMRVYNPIADENQLLIDLGAKYWLDRIVLLSPESPPPAFQVRIADGSVNPGGELVWTAFEERRNLAAHQHVEERFRTQEVRYIEVRRLEFSRTQEEKGNLSEVQAYGEGYVSEVVMNSPFIRLERPRLFSTVEWDGQAPVGTRLEVRTRSGDEILQIPHYYATTGREISKTLWELIPEGRRPPVVIEERPGPEWSAWSEVYQESGAPFQSPSPREAVLVQVRLVSRQPLRAARLRSLRLRFEPPLVDRAIGEIWPIWQVRPGQEREFTLYLRPQFAAGNPGFDRLRLRSSSAAPMEMVSVRRGGDAALRLGGGQVLWPGELEVQRKEEGAVELVFPQPVVQGDQVYEIRFRTKVFLQSTIFTAELERQTRPGRVQAVSDGDASSLVASQSLVVVSDLEGRALLRDVEVAPRVFTPNGDGINERAELRLSVFHLEGEKELGVEIFDLAGHRVRDLSQFTQRPSGEHRLEWDGRDEQGRLVGPGTYLVRVRLGTDSQAQGTEAVRIVHVVY
jgi:hypothetical protein